MPLDSHHLEKFINQHGIEAELLRLEDGTPTVTAAAATLGVDPNQIIKSILFLANDQPVLVIANGLNRIDSKILADYLGVSRRRTKIANASQVEAVTGYEAGGVPPFGHKRAVRTVLEAAVLSQSVVYGGGGENYALMRLTVDELRRVVGEEFASLAEAQ